MDSKVLFENILCEKTLRTIDESEIIEMLLVWGFAFDLDHDRRTQNISIIQNAIERFVKHGLHYEKSLNRRLYDPTEVINFMKWLDQNQHDFFWSDYVVPTGQKLVESLNSKLTASQASRTFAPSLSFSRTFNLSSPNVGKKIRLRVPTGAHESELRNIKIDFDAFNHELTNANQELSTHQNYLQLDIVHFHSGIARIHYECIAPYKQNKELTYSEPKISTEDRDLYTQSSEGFIKVSDRIKKLARSIAGHNPPEEQTHALWRWILDNMMFGLIHYHLIDLNNPTDWALDRQVVDCQIGSALLISFCRALGIPARLVGGYTLYSEAPSQHYWAQIWIPRIGWRSYDLIAWDLSRGGLLKDWRNIFEGKVDPRFITEIFPRNVVGNIGVSFPSRYHRIVSSTANGIEIRYKDAETGRLIYSDVISVHD